LLVEEAKFLKTKKIGFLFFWEIVYL